MCSGAANGAGVTKEEQRRKMFGCRSRSTWKCSWDAGGSGPRRLGTGAPSELGLIKEDPRGRVSRGTLAVQLVCRRSRS